VMGTNIAATQAEVGGQGRSAHLRRASRPSRSRTTSARAGPSAPGSRRWRRVCRAQVIDGGGRCDTSGARHWCETWD
jgi:hypothetical protein